MPTGLTTRVIEHLRRVALPRDGIERGDGELLGRFVERRDEAAIAALVERHGPMVWGVCRRLLNHHDAEDAFQATLLVLVRKAASIAPREMVGNWLYGVAHQTALQARRTATRRGTREVRVTAMPDTVAAQQDLWSDVQPLLDEELSRLPDIYRAVIVLCDLEGRTRKEVARQLAVPEGTVGGRLARARAMLAKRLARRGVVLSSGALAAVLAHNAASACPPTSVASNTISAASSFAAGPGATGPVSVKVAVLTEGVLKAMLLTKLKAVIPIVLLLGFLTAGATALSVRSAWARGDQPPATEPKVDTPLRPVPELNRPGAALPDLAGTWQGDNWGTVVLRAAKDGGFEGTYSDTFGKDIGRIAVRWSAVSRRYEGTWSEGTYRFGRIALDAPKDSAISGAYTTDPKCEHQPGVPSLASLRWSKKTEKDAEKEPVTAWGKEINGLQAGLALKGTDTYHPGGSVELEVKLRNVGKAEIKVTHGLLQEYPPAITDVAGVRMTVAMPPHKLYKVRVTERILKPGETITLYNPVIEVQSTEILRMLGELRVETPTMYVPPGKYKVAFGGMVQSHPALTTGTVEIAVGETAWGEAVDGVQAGLGFLPGQRRAYHTGETAKVVVRVRNTGMKNVKFVYAWESFYEQPPVVTDGAGKPVPFPGVGFSGLLQFKEVTLAPGKEVDLCELNVALQPASEKEKARPWTLYDTGKFQLQFERIGGNIGTGEIKFDPVLSKLVTGKLELEVKSDPPLAAPEKK